ncbi:MAG: hypothetical protein QMD14_03450 [Candidatus Aenigmarchaeota archaeon]|nr:hypothetical protein [Candidatus Aenigmarchaeota archaeon]
MAKGFLNLKRSFRGERDPIRGYKGSKPWSGKAYSIKQQTLEEINQEIRNIEKYFMRTRDLGGALTQLDNLYKERGYKLDNEDKDLKLPGGIRLHEAQEIYERAKLKLEKLAKVK